MNTLQTHTNGFVNTAKIPAQIGLNPQREQALEVLLEKAYGKLAGADFKTPPKAVTAETASNTILQFIENRLKLDKADGADQEALASRLQAGLEGFKKGFEEARSQIEALGLLSPDIEQDIGRTYDLVLKGVDALRQEYIGSKDDQVDISNSNPVIERAIDVQRDSLLNRNFSLDLTTRDGDRVVITAERMQLESESYSASDQEGGQVSSYTSASYTSQSYQFSVEGYLDDSELAAIADLMDQVGEIAQDFYAGDLDQAFEQALSLDMNEEALASYALNLTQVEVQRAQVAYQQVGENSAPQNRPHDGVTKFTQDLSEALKLADQFSDSVDLLLSLFDKQVEPSEQQDKLLNRVDQMLEYLA